MVYMQMYFYCSSIPTGLENILLVLPGVWCVHNQKEEGMYLVIYCRPEKITVTKWCRR